MFVGDWLIAVNLHWNLFSNCRADLYIGSRSLFISIERSNLNSNGPCKRLSKRQSIRNDGLNWFAAYEVPELCVCVSIHGAVVYVGICHHFCSNLYRTIQFNVFVCLIFGIMQNNQNSFCQCRLCGVPGHHEIDVWNENEHTGPNTELPLTAKILECVGVLVGI